MFFCYLLCEVSETDVASELEKGKSTLQQISKPLFTYYCYVTFVSVYANEV